MRTPILAAALVAFLFGAAAVLANTANDTENKWFDAMKQHHEEIHGDDFYQHHQDIHGDDWREHVKDCHSYGEGKDETQYGMDGMGYGMM